MREVYGGVGEVGDEEMSDCKECAYLIQTPYGVRCWYEYKGEAYRMCIRGERFVHKRE